MPTQPSGQQLEQLQSALLDAFDHAALTQLVRYKLDLDLEWITPVQGKRDLTTIVADLVAYYANQEDGIKRLLVAAGDQNQNNPELIALANAWADLEFAPLPLPENHPSIQASQRGVAAGNDIKDSILITGDGNTLQQIDTSGGTNIQGNVKTDGDFVGRDKHVGGDEIKGDKLEYYIGQIIHQSQQVLDASEPEGPAPGDPPYKGLQFFGVDDAGIFFGREQLTAKLVSLLRQQRLLVVIGASGSGKSSLVRAGLVASLRSGRVPGVEVTMPTGCQEWPVYLLTPGARPLESLAVALTHNVESVTAASTLIDDLRRDVRSLHLYSSRLLSNTSAQQLLLVVDQFEELFTLCRDVNEQRAFVDALLTAALDYDRTIVVITLRADFYAACARFERLRAALESYQKYIGLMSQRELQQAIERPAKQGAWTLEPGLIEQLLADVNDEPGSLPLLSHALDETWQRRRGRQLTLASYVAAGGIKGAIAHTADATYQDFSPEQQAIARAIFLRLTELGEGVQDTRRRVALAELKFEQTEPEQVALVLKALADARLVTTDADEVQVMHEAIIREWPRLRDEWLADNREGLRIHRRLTEAAQEWQTNGGSDPNDLYRGSRLSQVQEWASDHSADLNQTEQAFLQASQVESDQQIAREAALAAEREASRQRELEDQRQRTRLFRNWSIVAGVLLLVAILAAGVSFYLNGELNSANTDLLHKNNELDQTNAKLDTINSQLNQTVNKLDSTNRQLRETGIESQRQATIALSRQLAAQSTSEMGKNNYELAILLAIESGRVSDTFEAFSSIRTVIANPWHSRIVLYGHTNSVSEAIWSRDENKILTISDDHTARIWDATSGHELVKLTGVDQATWSKDKSKILTTSNDYTVRVWDAASGHELVKLAGVDQATWSKDESKILTSSNDNIARIWDAQSGQELVKLVGHTDRIWQAIWSQDDSKILTTTIDGVTRIWNAASGTELLKLESAGATWSKDESKIFTFSDDYTARIWDTATGKELLKLEGIDGAWWSHDEKKILTTFELDTSIRDATTGQVIFRPGWGAHLAIWSPDDSKILTASNNGLALWDVANKEELVKLTGHTSWVNKAIWNRDESQILTASGDATARIWDTAGGQELLELESDSGGGFEKATWSQDESKMLTVSSHNTARIWDTASGRELVKLEARINEATWSQNDSKILTSNTDNTVSIWDAATGKLLLKLEAHRDEVKQARWNQDESKILTTSRDETARIWDVVTGKELLKVAWITSAAWSQEPNKLLTTERNGFAHIWDVLSGKALLEFALVNEAMWNQDGSKILTKSVDGIYIWDAESGKKLLKLEAYAGSILQAIWNKDESKILTKHTDNTIHIWDTVTGRELVKLKGHTDRIWQMTWSKDESKILTSSNDTTARIWDAATGKELVRFKGHTSFVFHAAWSPDESKILTNGSNDNTNRVWDAATGRELFRLGGNGESAWSKDGSKILTSSDTVRIWYVRMADLLVAACSWAPGNFTQSEWDTYMEGDYRPTCPNAPIPPDAIAAIQEKERSQVQASQVVSATQRLDQLNGWLQENGQFKNYGVDVEAWTNEIVATATAEALPPPTVTPAPSAANTPLQALSPLNAQPPSPLKTPTVTLVPSLTPTSP